MARYRIYKLNAAGRIACAGVDAICGSDQEAYELAQWMLDGHGQAEVWNSKRCVGRVTTHSVAAIEALGRFPETG